MVSSVLSSSSSRLLSSCVRSSALSASYRTALSFHSTANTMTSATSFFDLTAQAPKGPHPLKQYEGKAVLVVNVASKCGFTPQYKGLEELYQEYKGKGLVILGFPSNQFGGQEPGSDDEIASFCELNHGVTFPLMAKSDVNGDNENEVYHWLKTQKAGLLGLTRIKWNFEKFLVGPDGQVAQRYSSLTTPAQIKTDVDKVLRNSAPTTPNPTTSPKI